MPEPPTKKPMVGWYDPRQLINTGIQVLVSDLIGTRIDSRREQALAFAGQQQLIDYRTNVSGDFWFDYMADTGDGWDSTFHMASLVSRPSLQIGDGILPRGKFLLLGGDEIYPYATKKGYQERLVAPFEFASPRPDPDQPGPWDLYAIPGNHDWYDGLVSFLRQFTQERLIGRSGFFFTSYQGLQEFSTHSYQPRWHARRLSNRCRASPQTANID